MRYMQGTSPIAISCIYKHLKFLHVTVKNNDQIVKISELEIVARLAKLG